MKTSLLEKYSNIGTDDGGSSIGNCKVCKKHGVLIKDHVCRSGNKTMDINERAKKIGELLPNKLEYSTLLDILDKLEQEAKANGEETDNIRTSLIMGFQS